MRKLLSVSFIMIAASSSTLLSQTTWAADSNVGPTQPTSAENAERVNTDNIKEKYWARGDESEIGVVQNRTYSKAHKFEFQVLGGLVNSDPFVSTFNLGGRFGYHFNEYFSAHILAWKSWASPSSTQTNLLTQDSPSQVGTALNTDYAKSYYGGEFQASLLYGKLSIVGKAIIYYDLHLLAGLGETATESGNNFTQSLGVGQQFFVSKSTSILIDYRLMHYSDSLIQKTVTSQLGQTIPGSRANWTNVITVGVGFLFGSSSK